MKSGTNFVKGLNATMDAMRSERTSSETSAQRWKRLYRTPGGPLMAWLLDEAVSQELDIPKLAQELGVTVGYLSQLHSGLRETSDISREFAAACGTFLRVPSVVVQIVAGRLTLVDFVCATDLDRWVEEVGYEEHGEEAHLACGARLGPEELWLLPHIVTVLTSVASVHQTRA